MSDYAGRNASLKDEFEDASSRLDAAWTSGPSNDSLAMTSFATWFDIIYNEFYLLWEEGELSDATGNAALGAVEDMLEVHGPSHAAYKSQLMNIRECITPGVTYDDYPSSEVEDDEDDDGGSTDSN